MPVRPLTLRTDPIREQAEQAEQAKATLVAVQQRAEHLGTRCRRVRLDQIESAVPELISEFLALVESLGGLLPGPGADPSAAEDPQEPPAIPPAEVPPAPAPTTPKPKRKPKAQ
jgi:hypothetical protein